MSRLDRSLHWARRSWIDLAWAGFVGLNLVAMQVSPSWQTVPFLVIWVSLTAIYGVRLWRLGPTIVAVGAVTLATGALIAVHVLRGQQDAEYLVEVPLLAVMFVVMAWHGQRRQTALIEMRRVADHNLRLLEEHRLFLQDASHELRTPITVALGHTELIQRAAVDRRIANDARIATEELIRLRRLANQLLLLASAERADFLQLSPVDVGDLALDALSRWNHVPRRWSAAVAARATVQGDRDSLLLALDAIIENAVHHTDTDDCIELNVVREGLDVVVVVGDSGPGIPAADVERIFDRFSRADSAPGRRTGGVGLGLAVVKTIVQAHGGSVRVRSDPGCGSRFELVLKESAATPYRKLVNASGHGC